MIEIIMTLIILAFVLALIGLRRARKYEKSLMPDDIPVQDEMQEETYNNRPLWIRPEEKSVWDAMSREEKRKTVRRTEKMIESGELYKHTDIEGFTGLITREEAKEKGYIK